MKQENKRIAFFMPSLREGGVERIMLNLYSEFTDKGFVVDLVLVHKEGSYIKEIPPGARIVDLGAKRVRNSILPLSRYLKNERPIVLLSAMSHSNVATLLAKCISRSKVRIVTTEHNTFSVATKDTPIFIKTVLRLLMRILYPKAYNIVAVSRGVADDLSLSTGLAREKIQVIYNPVVDEEIILKDKEVPNHSWFLEKQHPIILSVGRLAKQKNFSDLLRAFAQLRKKMAAKLVIVGEGEEREQLEYLIQELGIQEDVSMPGFVDDPYLYIAHSDVFVLSSFWEGLPTVLIEALACGTSVVSTDCPSGPREILENGKYGKLVPVGDIDVMVEAIKEALANPSDPKTLCSRAKDFSKNKIANEYLRAMGL